VTKDTTAPQVSISAVSAQLLGSGDSSTDVTWSATEDGPYSVRIGGTGCADGNQVSSGAYSSSPASRTTTIQAADLAEGQNTIRVCVTDAAGNTGTATTGVTKDTTPPQVTIDSVSKPLLGPADPTTDVVWHASEDGAFSARRAGSDCASGTQLASGGYRDAPAQTTTTVSAQDLAEGPNTVRLCVTDAAGNTASATTTVTKVSVAPNVTIDNVSVQLLGPAASSTAVNWHADQNGSFSVRVGGTDCAGGAEIASGSYGNSPAVHETTVGAAALQEGSNTIRVCVVNVFGSTGSDVATLRKDTTAPQPSIASVSPALLGAAQPSTDITWNADENGSYSVRVGGTDCTTGNAVASGGYSSSPGNRTTTIQAADLAAGQNTIRVCVTDAAGNIGSATATVTKDTTAPEVAIDSVSHPALGLGDSSTDVTWHASKDGPYRVRVGGGDCGSGTETASGSYAGSPAHTTNTIQATDLNEGDNSVRVCVSDAAGNTGGQATIVTKDTTVHGFPRPRAATTLRVPLVPAFRRCTAPNTDHGAPLAFGSCGPPVQVSDQLTIGTSDANRSPNGSIGAVTLRVHTGDLSTPENDADVALDVSITDVRLSSDLSAYTGELLLSVPTRMTDSRNGTGVGEATTVSDFALTAAVPCSATSIGRAGATCSLSTTIDSLLPGSILEGKRTVREMGQVQLLDGGPDGVAATPGNSVFAVQGVFAP
jgi:hypothetical protein